MKPPELHPSMRWVREQLYNEVEAAIRYGYSRAHKHTDTPEINDIVNHIDQAVTTVLDEALAWPDEED